jgi:D-tagatose-1,6-bisphosphate aldolase subunit GatZ/KbaZ
VIGTEVPIPGGEIEEPTALDVTSKLSLDRTITSHKKAWESHGIMDSWGRIAAIVAQPGVDFGHSNIFTYQPEKSQRLSAHLKNYKSLVFEAHSTDYQPNHSLYDLVKQHFMFLKVGPELTFKFREAIFALSEIASEMGSEVGIDLKNTIRDAMHENPEHWEPYYSGSMSEIEFMQKYSFSDRIRYYWPTPKVADALNKLIEFLSSNQINETLVGQNFMSYDFGDHPIDPVDLINNHIHQSIRRYYQACGFC